MTDLSLSDVPTSMVRYKPLFQRLLNEAQTLKPRCKTKISRHEDHELLKTGEIPERLFDRVLALSDVHGDAELLLTQLERNAKVVEVNYESGALRWIGGKTAVVLNGDLVDRYRPGSRVDTAGKGIGEFKGEE